MTVLEHFGLQEQPFGATPNPKYLYESSIHARALRSLASAIQDNVGFATLVGGPGLGKTTTIYELLNRFSSSSLRTALLFNTQCNSTDLLRYVAADLELPATSDPVELHEHIRQLLAREAQRGRSVLLVIDEAQNLDASVLETVRLLSDFETATSKMLNIILAGQAQLATVLNSPKLTQLAQRIVTAVELRPLTVDEAAQYVHHRLRVAGYRRSGPLFSPGALALICKHSDGIPRNINRICYHALRRGAEQLSSVIDAGIVRQVEDGCEIGDCVDSPHPSNRENGCEHVLALSEFGWYLLEWSSYKGNSWRGSVDHLLTSVNEIVPASARDSPAWPQDSRSVAERLGRHEAKRLLQARGLNVRVQRHDAGPDWVTISPASAPDCALPQPAPATHDQVSAATHSLGPHGDSSFNPSYTPQTFRPRAAVTHHLGIHRRLVMLFLTPLRLFVWLIDRASNDSQ